MCICIPVEVLAQWRGAQLSRLGPAEGLPAIVNEIAQDSTGYLYLGTNTGLYRYDGHSFDYFGHDPLNEKSIGPSDISDVYIAKDGIIWLTLHIGGLNRFDPKTAEFRRYALPSLPFRSIPGAHAIYEDDDGTLWIGGTHFRLLTFDRASEAFTVYSPDWIDPLAHGGRLSILSITPDPRDANLLWLSVLDYGSEGSPLGSYGTVVFNKTTKSFTSQPCGGRVDVVDKNNIFWGSYWGNVVSRFDPKTTRCDLYHFTYDMNGKPFRGVNHGMAMYQDVMYIASSRALLKFDGEGNFEPIHTSSATDMGFLSLFSDRSENFWIGTSQGALIMNPDDQHIRFFSLEAFGTIARLFPGRLTYYAPEETTLLVHSSDPLSRRIYRIPVDPSQKDQVDYIPTEFQVHGIASDHRNRVWIGGDGDFHLVDPVSGQISPMQLMSARGDTLPWILNMKSDANGWVAAIGEEQFFWFHADRQEVNSVHTADLPGSDFLKTFDNDFDGFTLGRNQTAYLWSNEIFVIDLQTGNARVLKHSKEINPNLQLFQYVGEGPEGDLWISSIDMVGRFDQDGDSLRLKEAFTISDGMISPMSQELHIDVHGRVWAFTNSGMNCIDPQTREVRYFSTKEGLPNPFIDPRQVIDVTDGSIATVCANGLIIYDPDQLWRAVAPSNEPIVIKQIRVGGEQLIVSQLVNNLSSLDLKPGETLVDIEFQALSYPTDYRMEYSYRIGGLHDDWISIGQNRFVTLPSLSPGNYTFQVKAGKPTSDAPVKSLAIHVGTPIYLQPWFLILAALTIIGVISAIMQWRIRRIRNQEASRTEVNKKIAELELKALRSQMNPHFMFNSLNSIKNYILHAEPKLAAEYLSNFAHLIRLILQNSREKSISLQEELETLMLYIDLEKLRFDEEFDFSCSVEEGLHLEHVRIPPMLLQPYVENAIWHGLMHKKEKGHLQLRFTKENGKVSCIIEDDGVGREAAAKMKSLSAVRYKSMGMGITKDRIEIMNKIDALGIDTEVTDKKDADGQPAGTRVIVRIPGGNGLPH